MRLNAISSCCAARSRPRRHLDRSAISGRYANVRVGGQTASLYFEQSGRDDGPVLLLLHTAGADSRQYHALMTDAELGATWRMLAFDMPGHGRSPPLPGKPGLRAA